MGEHTYWSISNDNYQHWDDEHECWKDGDEPLVTFSDREKESQELPPGGYWHQEYP